jgi:hypothetical protein
MFKWFTQKLLLLSVWALLFIPHLAWAQSPYSCVISTSGGHTCDNLNVSVINSGGSTRLGIVNLKPNPNLTWKYLVVRVQTCSPSGWTFHIGDSVSNDGGGRDSGDAQHDAELQVLNSAVTVYQSDYQNAISVTASSPLPASCATSEYRLYNHFVSVDPNVSIAGNESAWLAYFFDFPPYDEPDAQDFDHSEEPRIYLGLNRTYADPTRSGSGLVQACVFLSAFENDFVTGCPF